METADCRHCRYIPIFLLGQTRTYIVNMVNGRCNVIGVLLLSIGYTREITYHMKILLGGLYSEARKNDIFKLTTGRDSLHKTNNHTDKAATLPHLRI